MPERPRDRDADRGLTADELEQRQRADGTWEEPAIVDDAAVPLSPDVMEQRQRLDGSLEGPLTDDTADGPLSADMIEQRQVVEDDDLDDRPTD